MSGARAGGPALSGYGAARERAAWFRDAGAGVVVLTGEDRAAFLHKMVSHDVAGLAPGGGVRACLLTPKARLIAPMHVLADGDRLPLLVPRACAATCAAHLSKLVFIKKVVIEDTTGRARIFGLEGPASGAVLAAALGGDVPEVPELGVARAEIAGVPACLVRWSLAPGGWRLIAGLDGGDAPAACEAVRAALAAAVAAEGGEEAGAAAVETLRIEAGEPAWGTELTDESFIPETGLEQTHVSYTKGCYPGQEPIARVHFKGRTNRTRGAVAALAEDQVLAPGDELFAADGKKVGHVTSACWSPALGRALALATIRREVEEPGSRVRVGSAEGPEAEVATPPRAAAR